MPRLGQAIKPRLTPAPAPIPGARWIALTKDRLALVDEADFPTLARFSWAFHWQGYAFRRNPQGDQGPACLRMHREILGVTDPAIAVDHVNGNSLDNRRENLRRASHTENGRNNPGKAGRAIPFKGVYASGRPGKPWSAKITVDGLTRNLGRFATPEEAGCGLRPLGAAAFRRVRENQCVAPGACSSSKCAATRCGRRRRCSHDEHANERRFSAGRDELSTGAPTWGHAMNGHSSTIKEVLGKSPDSIELACLWFDIHEAVRRIEAEIAAGRLPRDPLRLRGRNLAEWLSLDEVARLFYLGRRQARA